MILNKSFGSGLRLIIWRSLIQHTLSTCITAFSIALGAGLLMAIFSLNTQTYQAFTGGSLGFDGVLGAKGSQLQLVLNTVFHLETSPGNIPWKLYQDIRKQKLFSLDVQENDFEELNQKKIPDTIWEALQQNLSENGKKISEKKELQIEFNFSHHEWEFRDPSQNTTYFLSYKEDSHQFELAQKNSLVSLAIPYALGDNYHGFRIVGTLPEIFTQFEYQENKKFQIQKGGRIFEPLRQEAVIGSYVAQKTGLKVGSRINPYHGLVYEETAKHQEEYVIVGIMETSNSPSDRVIWIPIEGVFRIGGHVLRGSGTNTYVPSKKEAIPDEHKEVSAVMLKFSAPEVGFFLNQTINRQGNIATLAWPIGVVMADLFEKMGWVNKILELVAYLIIVVATGSILASLYNTMNERKREFAILRALGAKRRFIFLVIILEAATIAFIGTIFGYLCYFLILGGASFIIQTRIGISLNIFAFHWVLVWTPLGMFFLGAIAGIIPAWKAYKTDVASLLTPMT